MTSLEDLRDAIRKVDPAIKKLDISIKKGDKEDAAVEEDQPGQTLEALCYNLSYNKALGFPNLSPGFHVALPYDKWPEKNYPDNHDSVLEKAFKDTVLSGGDPHDTDGYYFIDIVHLKGGVGQFFSESSTGSSSSSPSVAQTIANKVNSLGQTHSGVTPVIRILIGRFGENDGTEDELRDVYGNIFWNGVNPLVTNTKAHLHIGYYGPEFVKPSM